MTILCRMSHEYPSYASIADKTGCRTDSCDYDTTEKSEFFSPQQDFLIGKVKPNFTLDKLPSHRSCIGW